MTPGEPPRDCPRCARLVDYRRANALRHPGWFNGAVPSCGDPGARLLVLGLAPGVGGANRTGRPVHRRRFRRSAARRPRPLLRFSAGDGYRDCLVSNAVRCVPPRNRPTSGEIAACRPFLAARIAAMPRLGAVLCLGRIAHDAVLRALGERPAAHPFAHGARHRIEPLAVFDSYHCSRLNTNTGRLTPAMLETVVGSVRDLIGPPPAH